MRQQLAEKIAGSDPQQLCRELQQGDGPDLKRRRRIIQLSLIGMGAMTALSLLQTGIVKHLPASGCFDEMIMTWANPIMVERTGLVPMAAPMRCLGSC